MQGGRNLIKVLSLRGSFNNSEMTDLGRQAVAVVAWRAWGIELSFIINIP